jgi:hypothetical protein
MISVFGSKVGPDEIANVVASMESQWMGFGGNVGKFEDKFSAKYRVPNFAMVDSGSNAFYGDKAAGSTGAFRGDSPIIHLGILRPGSDHGRAYARAL